ncbi:MAG: hypothetical protein ACRDBG_04645 [Waterburya sp.]
MKSEVRSQKSEVRSHRANDEKVLESPNGSSFKVIEVKIQESEVRNLILTSEF